MSDSATPGTVAHQAPLSVGFSRQEYWSGLHSLLQGIFPTQGSNPGLLHWKQILYHLSHQSTMLCYVLCLVAQSCPTLCDPMDYTACQAPLCPWASPGKNTGVGCIPFSRGSSQPRDQTQVSCMAGGFVTVRATREAQEYWSGWPIPFSRGIFPTEE